MAATPVYGTVTLKGAAGVIQAAVTTTDVADGWVTWDDSGQKFLVVPFDCYIEDIAMSGDGTDTKKWKLYVNSRDAGITVRLAGLVNTVNNRIPVPLGAIRAGSMIQFKELA